MPESIENLTRAIASGDPEAFARFFDRYFDTAMREAARCVRGDESTRLDIVQEAMIRFIRSGRRFEHEAALVCWIRRAVQSCAYDHLRGLERRRRLAQASARRATWADESPAMDEADEMRSHLQWLRTEIAALDREERDLMTMRHRFGWTLQQIGDTLRLTPGAVDGRLRRILDRLRRRAKERIDVTPESD